MVQCAATQQEQDDKAAKSAKDNSSVRQLLGMKGASVETNKWKIRLQLTKPVTWVPLIWGEPSITAAITAAHFALNPCGRPQTDRPAGDYAQQIV